MSKKFKMKRQIIKVSNPKVIAMNYFEYLIDFIAHEPKGNIVGAQLMDLLELTLHVKKGMYCPKCNKEIPYEEALKGQEEYVKTLVDQAKELYEKTLKEEEEKTGITIKNREIPEDLMKKIVYNAKSSFLLEKVKCPDCETRLNEVYAIKGKENSKVHTLVIKGVEINSTDFEEIKALIPRQNILDYDDDIEMDADLKEELKLKNKLQNKDYTAPTLEKQLLCVGISTGYTLDYLHTIPIRKLSMMLRLVDRKNSYYAQLQASMSGMVEFKEGSIKHWIFTDDKKNIANELTNLQDFEKKFEMVT